MVCHLSAANFEKEVMQSQIPVLVDFWAPWCGPCQMMGPVLESLATEYAGRLKVAKVNVDEEQGLAGQYEVSGIPMFVVFNRGEMVETFTGGMPARALAAKVAPYLK